MAGRKTPYQVDLDAPLPYPEDPELAFMTVDPKDVKELAKPPGVQSLRQWGMMTFPQGKHAGETFYKTIVEDPEYAGYMRSKKKLTSDWAISFQGFVRAWEEAQGTSMKQTVIKPRTKPMTRPKETESRSVSPTAKRILSEEEWDEEDEMEAEIERETLAQMQTQMAILQDRIDQMTKNVKK